jgi:anti-anti-sigma regulatory factor
MGEMSVSRERIALVARRAVPRPHNLARMRTTQRVQRARELRHGDHLCWGYDDERAFSDEVADFFEEGLRRGERLLYVADAEADALLGFVARLDRFEQILASGQLTVSPLSEAYRSGDASGRPERVDGYRTAATSAIRDGYAGFRVAAEVTSLVVDADDRMAFVRYEREVDDAIARLPMSALCAYDVHQLGDEGLFDLACVHPAVGGCIFDVPFSMYRDGDDVVLLGELDAFSAERFRAALAGVGTSEDRVRIDLSGLTFIDTASIRRFGLWLDATRRSGRQVEVAGVRPLVERCGELMGLTIR